MTGIVQYKKKLGRPAEIYSWHFESLPFCVSVGETLFISSFCFFLLPLRSWAFGLREVGCTFKEEDCQRIENMALFLGDEGVVNAVSMRKEK